MRVFPPRATDRCFLTTAVAALLVAVPGLAQSTATQNSAAPSTAAAPNPITHEGFQSPPAEIASTVLAPRHLNVTLSNPSPDRKYFIKAQSEGMPTMAIFAKPHYYLGGIQVDHRANRARS